MTWTTILKNEQEWELREQKQRREDKAASYDKPPKRHKRDIRDVESDDKCYVRKCMAISCKHNEDYNCTLENIDIDSKGVCRDFTPKKDIRDKPEDIRDKPRAAQKFEEWDARRRKDIRDKID